MAMFRMKEPEGEGAQEMRLDDPGVRKIHSDIQVLMLKRALGTERDAAKELKWVEEYSGAYARYMKEHPYLYHKFTLDAVAVIEEIERALYGSKEDMARAA